MLTTTEYRTHWIDASGGCYAERYPFTHPGQLLPVVNLDEVAAWIALATSEEMRSIGFPSSSPDDPAVHYLRLVLERGAATDDHLAAETARELTDDVPRYAMYGGRDWRTPFVAMRSGWPAPPSGPHEVRNLTPHPITIGEVTIQPSGLIVRASEESTLSVPLYVLVPDPGTALQPEERAASGVYAARNESVRELPTTTTRYTGIVDLPQPQPGVYLVVSIVVPPVAASRGRWTGDLLTPGQQVRDGAGRIVGCRSLVRYAP